MLCTMSMILTIEINRRDCFTFPFHCGHGYFSALSHLSSRSSTEMCVKCPMICLRSSGNTRNAGVKGGTNSNVFVTMSKYFVIFDLDDTLIDSVSRQSYDGVFEALNLMKDAGHFLAVCSNNVLAKSVLLSFNMLDLFDFIVAHSSWTNKSLELLECWRNYRFLYNRKLVRQKIHVNRMVFIDDDAANRNEALLKFKSIHVFVSVAKLLLSLKDIDRLPPITISEVRTRIRNAYATEEIDPQRVCGTHCKREFVYLCALGKHKESGRGEVSLILQLWSLRRCVSVVEISCKRDEVWAFVV